MKGDFMRKTFINLISIFFVLLLVFTSRTAAANTFFDVISHGVSGVGRDKTVDAGLYGANTKMAWDDVNLNGEMDGSEILTETIRVFDRNGDLVVESPNGLNLDQMEDWAAANASLILKAFFPSGLSESTGASIDGFMSSTSLSGKMAPSKPRKTVADSEAEGGSNEFKGVLEFLSLSVNDQDGHAASVLIGFESSYDSGVVISTLVPYRFTSMDDEVNSESHFIGVDLSVKYPVKEWGSLIWDAGMGLFGSLYYLTSDAIDHSGSFRYGAGVFSLLTKTFDFATLSAGADFKISDFYLPSSWIETDDKFLDEAVDYFNDLDAVKTLSYGFNLGVPFADNMAGVNLETIRSNFYSNDILDERDAQTTVGLIFSYYPSDTFELTMGARKTFELEDIDLFSVFLGAQYRY